VAVRLRLTLARFIRVGIRTTLFADVPIYERGGVFFALNIADYEEAVHADEFDSAIFQIAVGKQPCFHAYTSVSPKKHGIRTRN